MAELLPECRLIIEEEPRSGAWNMALDETLLETAIGLGLCTLRWYRWETATASLGYFQGHAELADDPRVAALPAVRRLSGGGTIVHDEEWTYCLTLPATQRVVYQPHELYDLVHREIVRGLRSAGFEVDLRGETVKAAPEPVLCFARQDAHDVVSGGRKVLGSAQRRRKGALLQHGSLILRGSSAAPQHPGLLDLNANCETISTSEIAAIGTSIAGQIAEHISVGGWRSEEVQRAAGLEREQPGRVLER